MYINDPLTSMNKKYIPVYGIEYTRIELLASKLCLKEESSSGSIFIRFKHYLSNNMKLLYCYILDISLLKNCSL